MVMKISRRQLRELIKEAMSPDPVQQILKWAKEGGRVTTAAGVLMWPGIGNRSGLHSYANELALEKWEEGGEYFTRQIEKLHPGHKIVLKRFKNVTRDRGKWITDKVVVLTEPPAGAKTGEQPSRDVLKTIYDLLSHFYERDIGASNISNISLFPDAEENGAPWSGKVWKVTIKGEEYLFKDDPASTELAEDTYDDGIWETIRVY